MHFQNAQKNDSKISHGANRLTTVLFIAYLLAITWILLFKLGVRFSYMANREVNFIPFREFLLYHGKLDASEIILNILIFVPLGIYTGILFENWMFGKRLFFFFLVSVIVEGLQFILAAGAFDSTDIVTNTTGGLIGLLLFKAVEKVFNNRVKTQKFINIVAAIATVVMLLFLFLLKMNRLPIRYQ